MLAGVVRMIDPPDEVRKKFKTAVTDSGTEVRHDPEEKPGVSNLIEIMAVATQSSIPEVEAQFDGQGYGAFKEGVAEAVVELLAPILLIFYSLITSFFELPKRKPDAPRP